MKFPHVHLVLAIAALFEIAIASEAVNPGNNSATIPVSKLENDSYDWSKRHEEVLRIKAALQPEIVLIGDSITHFWNGEPKAHTARGPKAWEAVFGKSRILNLGFGWDRTQNVLWRINHGELDGIAPRIVVLNIGTNNTSQTANARQNTAPEIAEGVRTVCDRIRAKLPQAKIILMAIFPREEDPDHPRRKLIMETNTLLARFAGDKGYTLVDIGPKMLQPDGHLTQEIMPDFCHPSEKGYQIWAEALIPLIQTPPGRN